MEVHKPRSIRQDKAILLQYNHLLELRVQKYLVIRVNEEVEQLSDAWLHIVIHQPIVWLLSDDIFEFFGQYILGCFHFREFNLFEDVVHIGINHIQKLIEFLIVRYVLFGFAFEVREGLADLTLGLPGLGLQIHSYKFAALPSHVLSIMSYEIILIMLYAAVSSGLVNVR